MSGDPTPIRFRISKACFTVPDLKNSKFCSQSDGGLVGALLEESKRGPALSEFFSNVNVSVSESRFRNELSVAWQG